MNESCAICLGEFADNKDAKIAEVKCTGKHIFHVACLEEWIKKNDICPLCREPILKDDKNS